MNGLNDSNPCRAAITLRSDLSVSPRCTLTSSVSFSRRFIDQFVWVGLYMFVGEAVQVCRLFYNVDTTVYHYEQQGLPSL